MSISLIFATCAIGGYLLGSIPFGLVLTRMCGLGDIRKIGSGNIGATNVLRTGRKDLALLTVILDASKAGIAAYLAYKLTSNTDIIIAGVVTQINITASLIAGTCGVLGHNFPIWLKFKGGKAVSTGAGVAFGYSPAICLIGILAFTIVYFATKIVSLGSIVGASSIMVSSIIISILSKEIFLNLTSIPTTNIWPLNLWFVIGVFIIVVIIIIRHKTNINRLIHNEELAFDMTKHDTK